MATKKAAKKVAKKASKKTAAKATVRSFPLDQVMKALCALRAAAHLPQESFSAEQFVGMISDEIEVLREHGHKDAEIAFLIHSGSDIDISEAQIRKFYITPEARGKQWG